MSRLLTTGFAIADTDGGALNRICVDYQTNDTTNVNNQTSVKRTGDTSAMEILASTGFARSTWSTSAGTANVRYYARFYYRISGTPSANSDFFRFYGSGGETLVKLTIDTSRQLILKDVAGTQVGSASSALSVDTWYRIEVMMMNGSTASTDELELRIDGVTVASSTTNNAATVAPNAVQFGSTLATTIGITQYFAALAVNDDQGASQSSWPGDGNIVLLKPISDNQVGSWTGGVGGTTNLYDAVDNTPPAGTASESNTTQVESVDSSGDNATDEYRVNLTTYTDAGIGGSDTISVLHPVINHGEDASTGTKTGSFGLQANPAAAGYDTFTFGDNAGALGTWPSNWRWLLGTPVYAPSPTLGSSPVLAVRKTDAGTRAASVDFMGVYVDFTPAAVVTYVPRHGFINFQDPAIA